MAQRDGSGYHYYKKGEVVDSNPTSFKFSLSIHQQPVLNLDNSYNSPILVICSTACD